jgi:putative ABC transport system permease protein
MLNFSLALRNIGRNRRRSAVTILAVAISCAGLALFGGYASWTFRAVEEQTVSAYGHIEIYKKGYYEKGTGNPAAYAIDDYEKVKALVENDPDIRPKLELVTGQLLFNGLVTATRYQTASTFVGLGVFPSEDARMVDWNPYGIASPKSIPENARYFSGIPELADDDVNGASVGSGLAKVLQLSNTPKAPASSAEPSPAKLATPPNKDGGVDLGCNVPRRRWKTHLSRCTSARLRRCCFRTNPSTSPR